MRTPADDIDASIRIERLKAHRAQYDKVHCPKCGGGMRKEGPDDWCGGCGFVYVRPIPETAGELLMMALAEGNTNKKIAEAKMRKQRNGDGRQAPRGQYRPRSRVMRIGKHKFAMMGKESVELKA